MKSNTGKFYEETMPYLFEIKRFIEHNIGVTFEQLVCDFIRDEAGTWWFLNLKAYVLAPGCRPKLKYFVSNFTSSSK